MMNRVKSPLDFAWISVTFFSRLTKRRLLHAGSATSVHVRARRVHALAGAL